MPTTSLRDALVTKTSWTKQQLSARVQQLRKVAPMSTGTAHAVIAHQHGIKIDRYLDKDDLEHTRDVVARLSASMPRGTKAPSTTSREPRKSPNGKVPVRPRTIIFPNSLELTDPLLSDEKMREAREMAEVYPIIYVLENSMRAVVQRVLFHKYGVDWWDTALNGGRVKTLKTNSDNRRAKEQQTNWHQRRGAHPIDYIDLKELGEIILAKQDDFFPDVLGDNRNWFEHSLMPELVASRNVLCHMNPLDKTNTADVVIKAKRWNKIVAERRGGIPDA